MKASHRLLSALFFLVFFASMAIGQDSSAGESKLAPTDSTALLNISVVDAEGKHLKIDYMTVKGKKNGATFHFSRKTSPFSILVPNGETYVLTYKDLGGEEGFTEVPIPDVENVVMNFELAYEPPKIYTLDNVFFVSGKATLTPASYKELDELAEVMAFKKEMSIQISGHTDNVGDEAPNQRLSEARANAVRDYLIKKGTPASRVTAVGYGETKPIAYNDTAEGRQKNRRTEVKILSSGAN
ncbi:MAG: OmpA family protein [Flavobacteriales bacterium]|nr:OmpA family protein [Flavobacteriales bacterium]